MVLDLADGQITLRVGAADGGRGHDQVDAPLEGAPITIAFNPTLLLRTLQQVDGPTVEMLFLCACAHACSAPRTANAVTRGYRRHLGIEIPVPEARFADRVQFILTTTPPWTRRVTRWAAPLPVRPCSIWWSGSGCCCAAVTRRPAP